MGNYAFRGKNAERKQIMKAKIWLIIASVIILGASSLVEATIFELPLDCNGVYTSGSLWTTDFDFGTTFTSISNVYIDWSGEITAGLAVYDSNPDEPFPLDVGIKTYLSPPIGASATVWGGDENYPAPEPFNALSEFQLSGGGTWAGLLNGQGTISIYYTSLIIIDGRYIEPGSISVNNASLKVDGVPVPEPVSIWLLLVGLVGVCSNRHKASRYT